VVTHSTEEPGKWYECILRYDIASGRVEIHRVMEWGASQNAVATLPLGYHTRTIYAPDELGAWMKITEGTRDDG